MCVNLTEYQIHQNNLDLFIYLFIFVSSSQSQTQECFRLQERAASNATKCSILILLKKQ